MISTKLETDRLYLRILEAGDVLQIEKMHLDPDLMKYSGAGGPLTSSDNFKYCCMQIGHWQLKGYGMYVLEDKLSGDFCGMAGLRYLEEYPYPEMGWILPKPKWGKGYAFEAANAIKDHVSKATDFKELYHFMAPENTRAIHLAEKLGAKKLKEISSNLGGVQSVTDVMYISTLE